MNERFLELARQLPGWVSTDDGAYIGPHSSALKLYAELIVRECATVVSLHSRDEIGCCKGATNAAYKGILSNFGVEE
jgi:hypothetical protein